MIGSPNSCWYFGLPLYLKPRPNSSTCQVAGCYVSEKMLGDIRDVSAHVCKIALTNRCNFEGRIEWKINGLNAVTVMYKWRRDEYLEYMVQSKWSKLISQLLWGMRWGIGASFQRSPRPTPTQASRWTLQFEAFTESALTKWQVHYQGLSQYNVAHTKSILEGMDK